mgnify:CR=1 FL=1
MKKIVIIGANSYLARNLIYVINKQNIDCQLELYGRSKQHIDGEKNYTCIDVLNRESVKRIDFDCDIIYFFVGKTGSANAFQEYETFIDVNEKALLNVMSEYVEQKSTAKLVFPSTRLIYEGNAGILKEEDTKAYKSIYAINKHACERYIQLYHEMFNLQFLIFRICIPYGSLIADAISYGTMEFMLNNAKQGKNISIYGDGNIRRTLTYIEDLCQAMIKGATSQSCQNDIYNIGGEEYTLGELAECVAEKYHVKVNYVPWPEIAKKMESGGTVFDSAKLDSIISYQSTSLKAWIKGEI